MTIRPKLPRKPNKMKIVNNSFYHKIATIIKPNKQQLRQHKILKLKLKIYDMTILTIQ